MKDMFYNYDTEARRNKKTYPEIIDNTASADTMYSLSTAEVVFDINGNEKGIRAYSGNDITFYFNFTGNVDCTNPVDFLNRCDIKLELLDAYNSCVYSKTFWNEVDSNGVLKVTLFWADLFNAGIKKDLYRVRLTATKVPVNDEIIEDNDSSTYVLFYENDGFINFI